AQAAQVAAPQAIAQIAGGHFPPPWDVLGRVQRCHGFSYSLKMLTGQPAFAEAAARQHRPIPMLTRQLGVISSQTPRLLRDSHSLRMAASSPFRSNSLAARCVTVSRATVALALASSADSSVSA